MITETTAPPTSPPPTPPRPATAAATVPWTFWQGALVIFLVIGGGGIATPAFIEIYGTVTHLLHPSFGHLVWVVPVAIEVGYVGFFGVGVLLAIRQLADIWWRTWAMLILAVASVLLQVASAKTAPEFIGHAAVVLTFLSYFSLAKVAITRVIGGKRRPDKISFAEWLWHFPSSFALFRWMTSWGEPSKARAQTRYTALLYAIALAQSDPRIGRGRRLLAGARDVPWWKSQLPPTLRWQLDNGQLPPEVLAEIATDDDGGAFQYTVLAWVNRELAHLDKRKPPAAVRTEPAPPATVPARPAGPAPAGETPPPAPGPAPVPARPTRAAPGRESWPEARTLTAKELAGRVRKAAEKYEKDNDGRRLPANRLAEMARLRIGRETAGPLLERYYAERDGQRSGDVTPIRGGRR